MDKIGDKLAGLLNSFVGFVIGKENQDSFEYSSAEEVECDSDCSVCDTENQPISLKSSRSSRLVLGNMENYVGSNNSSKGSYKRIKLNNQNENNRFYFMDDDKENQNIQGFNSKKSMSSSSNRLSKLAKEINQSDKDIPAQEILGANLKDDSKVFNYQRKIMSNRLSSSKKRRFEEISNASEQLQKIAEENPVLDSQQYIQQKRNSAQTLLEGEKSIQQDVNIEEEKLLENQEQNNKLAFKFDQNSQIRSDLGKTYKTSIIQYQNENQETYSLFLSDQINGQQLQLNKRERENLKPVLTIEDLLINKMNREKTLEIIKEFQTLKIGDCNEEKKSEFFQVSPGVKIDEAYFKLIQAQLTASKLFPEEIVIKNNEANYSLTKRSFERLSPGQWFNDEILNAYISLINQRAKQSFVFNTFFYTMIEEMIARNDYNYQKLARIVQKKKVNLRDKNYLMFPINIKQFHWFLIVFNLENQSFYVVDSMSSLSSKEQSQEFVSKISLFLEDYFKANKVGIFEACGDSFEEWTLEFPEVPQQGNGYDCGLCTCLNMELLSRQDSQVSQLMSYEVSKQFSEETRKRIACELMFGKLLIERDD